jgi:iron complex transport system permease protein
LAVYLVAKLKNGTAGTIVLAGIALSFMFHSLVSLLQYFASENELQAIVFWLFGSLIKATWLKLGITTLVLVLITPWFIVNAWKLTALRLGDHKAKSLGMQVDRLRLRVLIFSSILTAIAVCFVGSIGFIGLVAPHLSRMLVGEDQRFFLPFSALSGAFLLSAASVVSKLIIPGVIFPIGIITSLIGIPFFLSMIITKKRSYW